ncbi:MAG: hypothetical protein H7Y42_04920 [Chitinophagaceae bacterium]|nr:hypothetical protein [Chitinophagaceae bacterium]
MSTMSGKMPTAVLRTKTMMAVTMMKRMRKKGKMKKGLWLLMNALAGHGLLRMMAGRIV